MKYIKVVLEYMGEMDEDLFDDFDEAVRLHI
jgi:hypothetical protein